MTPENSENGVLGRSMRSSGIYYPGWSMGNYSHWLFIAVCNGKWLMDFDEFFPQEIITQDDYATGKEYILALCSSKKLIGVQQNYPIIDAETKKIADENTRYAQTQYDVITEQKKYRVFVEFYTKNPGEDTYINMIRKFKLVETETIKDNEVFFSDTEQRLGIYYPGWLEE